jgi:Holliday junction DNA helicase RuvA
MISRIEGTIIDKTDKFLVVNVGGIGFKVYSTADLIQSCGEIGVTTSIHTHLVVREDALDLYGFSTKDEMLFFEKLISISGIGPKTAINILSITTVSTIKRAISTGDISHLVKVSGIGKKIADKIVLELKGKVFSEENDSISNIKEEIDAVETLKALGYSQKEAREALQEIDKNITSVSDRVKATLKILGKK